MKSIPGLHKKNFDIYSLFRGKYIDKLHSKLYKRSKRHFNKIPRYFSIQNNHHLSQFFNCIRKTPIRNHLLFWWLFGHFTHGFIVHILRHKKLKRTIFTVLNVMVYDNINTPQ